MYIRHYSDCFKIQAENGESIREQLGLCNGNCQQLSSALVIIERNGFSQPHFHKEREEAYIMLKGKAKLIVNNETKFLKPGDLAFIPKGAIHQIFNEGLQELIFHCICGSAWIPEDFNLNLEEASKESGSVYVTSKAQATCIKNEIQHTYRLLGAKPNLGGSSKFNISFIQILIGKTLFSKATSTDGCYIIETGKGRFRVGEETKEIQSGELAKIPAGQAVRISNVGQKTLELYFVISIV